MFPILWLKNTNTRMFWVLVSCFSVLERRVIKMMELINYLPGTCDELEDEPVFVEMLFNRSLVL